MSERKGSYTYAVLPPDNPRPKMAVDIFFIAPSCLKIIFIITTAVILDCVDPVYTLSYGSVGVENAWGPIFIFIVSAFTFFYVVVSIIGVFAFKVNCNEDRNSACSVGEIIVCAAFAMVWLIITGYSGSVSWRSGMDSSTKYAWVSALAALNVVLFLVISVINCFKTGVDKINKRRLNPHRI